ncbi:MAG: hypothetical protein O7H41_01850 [Planctomycetota bacterium]|nr:hypothetical protein [Planctomycetota bacterium]
MMKFLEQISGVFDRGTDGVVIYLDLLRAQDQARNYSTGVR